jgi:TetR/AcrR family transcriptional regulator, transcriptional repressor for nem operon
MRFEKGHKESTRRRIIDVASRRFRRDGVSASGLAGIMAEAGLTNGAFYPHFESKEVLLRETLANVLADQHAKFQQDSRAGYDMETAIRRYLNADHLRNCDEGCPSAALLPEIGRQPELTRKAYEDGLLPYIAMLAEYLPDPGSPSSKRHATAIFSLMVGTLQIARAVSDTSLAEDILEGGVEAALKLAREAGHAVIHSRERKCTPSSRSEREPIRNLSTKRK